MSALALTVSAVAVAIASAPAATSAATDDVATPSATCAPGDLAETGSQGRVSAADVASGRALLGYTCNTSLVGHHADGGQFKTLSLDLSCLMPRHGL